MCPVRRLSGRPWGLGSETTHGADRGSSLSPSPSLFVWAGLSAPGRICDSRPVSLTGAVQHVPRRRSAGRGRRGWSAGRRRRGPGSGARPAPVPPPTAPGDGVAVPALGRGQPVGADLVVGQQNPSIRLSASLPAHGWGRQRVLRVELQRAGMPEKAALPGVYHPSGQGYDPKRQDLSAGRVRSQMTRAAAVAVPRKTWPNSPTPASAPDGSRPTAPCSTAVLPPPGCSGPAAPAGRRPGPDGAGRERRARPADSNRAAGADGQLHPGGARIAEHALAREQGVR